MKQLPLKLIAIYAFLYVSCNNKNVKRIGVINHECTQFQMVDKNDTINFIVANTSLKKKKPILLFCQGSLPVPLFIRFKKKGYTKLWGSGLEGLYLSGISKHYYLVVISKPHTPVIADASHLYKDFYYSYLPDTSKKDAFSTAYQKADYLQNYVNRANRVLDYLKQQPWVDSKRIVIAGVSQGSEVAPKIALSRTDISCIGLFAADPFGRLEQYIRQARLNAEFGKITRHQADSIMNHWYQFAKVTNNLDSIKKHPEYNAWRSFGGLYINDWLKLKMPIYLAYGTSDITSQLCDMVPLYFIRNHKTNLTIKRYIGLNHTFCKIGKNGKRPRNSACQWTFVFQKFVLWSLKHH